MPDPRQTQPRSTSRRRKGAPGVDVKVFPADPEFAAGLDATERLQRENDHLRRIITTQPVIEQAKGVLMLRYTLDATRAFELLSRWSQTMGRRVSVVAQAVLQLAGLGEDEADPAVVEQLRQQLLDDRNGLAVPVDGPALGGEG
jgi:hypothetical protein